MEVIEPLVALPRRSIFALCRLKRNAGSGEAGGAGASGRRTNAAAAPAGLVGPADPWPPNGNLRKRPLWGLTTCSRYGIIHLTERIGVSFNGRTADSGVRRCQAYVFLADGDQHH